MIFETVDKVGVRALASKGWGSLNGDGNTPDSVYMLENTSHDWLFPKCAAVVHHGGAGTTAIGMKFGKPTMIVPFLGIKSSGRHSSAKLVLERKLFRTES